MTSMSLITSPPWLTRKSVRTQVPSASCTLPTGSRTRSSLSVNAANITAARPALLHCSFLRSSTSSSSLASSFSVWTWLSSGLDFNSDIGMKKKRGHGLVVRAGKAALCQTKRNRSRKSLARTHGFRRRTRTTSGRAILKRRRAKGRWVLCPKSYPNRGKRA
ncbi:hypothetical protein SLE2022_389300 [Rubroshorea leprosula]